MTSLSRSSTFIAFFAAAVPIGAAEAADIQSKKSDPVEYVRTCSAHGAGFFYLPGSDACIQIGGRVRGEVAFSKTKYRNADAVSMGALARIDLDVRQNTAYGMARAFIRYSYARSNSQWNGGSYITTTGGPGDISSVDLAYIQFAGLTAGRVQSFFDYYANNFNFSAIRDSDVKANALAYTFNFGGGWSLTGAIEDGNARRLYGLYNRTNTYMSPAPAWNGPALVDGPGYKPAGQTVPDAIAALGVEKGWGGAQIAAALHQVRPAFSGTLSQNNVMVENGTTNWNNRDAKYGWAVKGGMHLDLSMLAPKDVIWIEAAYTQGALSYIGANSYGFMPTLNIPMADAYVNQNGAVKLSSGWSAMFNFMHYWTPNIRSALYASYMKIDTDRNAYGQAYVGDFSGKNSKQFNYGFVPATELRIGTTLVWWPIKGLYLGTEILYTRVDVKGRVLSYDNGNYYAGNNKPYPSKTISYEDDWQARIRVNRDF